MAKKVGGTDVPTNTAKTGDAANPEKDEGHATIDDLAEAHDLARASTMRRSAYATIRDHFDPKWAAINTGYALSLVTFAYYGKAISAAARILVGDADWGEAQEAFATTPLDGFGPTALKRMAFSYVLGGTFIREVIDKRIALPARSEKEAMVKGLAFGNTTFCTLEAGVLAAVGATHPIGIAVADFFVGLPLVLLATRDVYRRRHGVRATTCHGYAGTSGPSMRFNLLGNGRYAE